MKSIFEYEYECWSWAANTQNFIPGFVADIHTTEWEICSQFGTNQLTIKLKEKAFQSIVKVLWKYAFVCLYSRAF